MNLQVLISQAQHFVDLEVHFANLEVQISWQTQHFLNLETLIL